MGPGVSLGNAMKTEDHGWRRLILASLSPLFSLSSLSSLCCWRLISSSIVNLMHENECMVALQDERERKGERERGRGRGMDEACTYVNSDFSLVYMWIKAFIFVRDSSQTELKHHRSFHSHLWWYWCMQVSNRNPDTNWRCIFLLWVAWTPLTIQHGMLSL